ncbi:hypothetical protein [Methylobacterium durans]|uniref:hypothetical protein n=1 Tax=Methylobacterium durans TaxID=2202825 RepID=UPI0013A54B1A|nr:hypothetical protein [Methylobacterium durans]
MKPVRLQLSRYAGFNLQEHSRATNGLPAVNVDRSTPWGNPFVAGNEFEVAANPIGWADLPPAPADRSPSGVETQSGSIADESAVPATSGQAPVWPDGCIKPNSCSRHNACMYARSSEQCQYFGRSILPRPALAQKGGVDAP